MGVGIYGGKVYVTGGASHTVSVFNLDGALVRHIDTEAAIPGPQGIAFDHHGNFVISSFYTGEVAQYAPQEATPRRYYEYRGIKVARSVAYLPLSADPQLPFIRGDFNRDGSFDISDPVAVLGYLFAGAETTRCLDAGDGDDNGKLDITDAIYLLGHLFSGGPAPLPPFPQSGEDPTDDGLVCY